MEHVVQPAIAKEQHAVSPGDESVRPPREHDAGQEIGRKGGQVQTF
jgi:hypothetical protein